MGSYNIKLSKTLKELYLIKNAQKLQKMSEYSRGLYNGLELAWALLNGVEPKFIEKQKVKNEQMDIRKDIGV